MENDVIVDPAVVAASEVLTNTAGSMFEMVDAARNVLVQKENFKKFSAYLKKIGLLLLDLSKLEMNHNDSFKSASENLSSEIKVAKRLISECSKRSKIFLFLNCRRIVEDLEIRTKNLGRVMNLFRLPYSDVSLGLNDELRIVCRDMLDTKYQVAVVEEQIMKDIASGIEDRNVDRSCANNLITCIAESLQISTEQSMLKTEFENFKHELENIELGTDGMEAAQMEQIILLLEKADIVSTPKEKEMKYLNKRNSLGRKLLEPLHSFYCPITGDIMVDPVETSSGQTFERAAIRKWLADGNSLCPLTKTPLDQLVMRPNKTLQQSIEEWRNRNIMISIASMKPEIQSGHEQEVLHSLKKLHEFCGEAEVYKEWIVIEGYIPLLIGLLNSRNHEVRLHVLNILCCLAKDHDDNKERMANVSNGIGLIVRSLARKIEEATCALRLLSELSRSSIVQGFIGKIQGCILLLVTLANVDDCEAAEYAREILENLAVSDQNIIEMAKANYFGPLLQILCTGTISMQMLMANTLSDIELTDHSKLWLFQNGALKSLLQLLLHSDVETKATAVRALRNLSSVPQNGLQMIKEGATVPLLQLLYSHSLSIPELREEVANTIMHLATSTTVQESSEEHVLFLGSEEEIFKLFSLISLAGPHMQHTLLRTFHAMCKSPFGSSVRTTLRQISSVKVLVQLLELDDHVVWSDALKLFYYLTEDDQDHATFLEHVNKKCIDTLIRIIEISNDSEEVAAALGIISHLPKDLQISQRLIDSGALEVIYNTLICENTHSSQKNEIVENATEGLCRFMIPTQLEWQNKAAETGIIAVLVNLLSSRSISSSTKRNIAISLKQLSENSKHLSKPVKRNHIFGCCFTSSETTTVCLIHGGICGVNLSFCLLEAKAMRPLVMVLGDTDFKAREASLEAILTLIDGGNVENSIKALDEVNGISPIIEMLSSCHASEQEMALIALQSVFSVAEMRQKYGNSAKMLLVDVTQRGVSHAKSSAAKLLVQLNVLHEQSSFF